MYHGSMLGHEIKEKRPKTKTKKTSHPTITDLHEKGKGNGDFRYLQCDIKCYFKRIIDEGRVF